MHDLYISKYSKLHMLTMITVLTSTVLTLMNSGYTIRISMITYGFIDSNVIQNQ